MVKHSNNSSAVADELCEFVHFVGLELKGLKFDLVFWQCCSCGNGANYANTQDFWNNFNNKTLFYRRITGNCWYVEPYQYVFSMVFYEWIHLTDVK